MADNTNYAPMVRFDNAWVMERAANGSRVAQLLGYDQEGDAMSFSLVHDAGGRFALHDGYLVVADGAANPAHLVRVRAIDGQGGSTEASFTIEVQDVDENEGPPGNAPPAMIMLDGVQVFENAASGTHIGQLRAHDPNGDALTFALLDNADGRFAIQDGRVVVADGARLDFETSQAHRIEVRVSDVHGAYLDAIFTIHVRDVPEQGPPPDNHAPSDIWMEGGVVLENAPNGIVFGQFGASDMDPGDMLNFELVDDADGRFALDQHGMHAALRVIDGSRLDYESASTHAIKVRVSDMHGASRVENFTIQVINVAEDLDSFDIEMHQGSVLENASGGTNVAHFSVTQPHPDPVTYELVDDAGGLFRLQGQALVVADGADIDYEANATHTIKVRATDVHGATTIETFTVKVLDVADEDETPPPSDNEAPTGLRLSDDTVAENTENGTTVGILVGEDEDPDETFTYTLLDNAGGRFALDGDQLVVADGARLDHEASPSHHVTVRVTDSEGASFTETFTLFVEDEVEETVQGTPGNDTIFGGAGSDALSGGLGNDVVTGGAGNDALSGDAGADRLFGGQGRDRISGGLGKDILTGGAGKDFFVFDKWPGPENIDRITDFSVRDDTIELDASTFKGIGKRGVLAKDKFWIGAGAHDSGDRVVYNSDNGKLYFDADGSGHKQAVLIAILKNNLMLSHKDFIIG